MSGVVSDSDASSQSPTVFDFGTHNGSRLASVSKGNRLVLIGTTSAGSHISSELFERVIIEVLGTSEQAQSDTQAADPTEAEKLFADWINRRMVTHKSLDRLPEGDGQSHADVSQQADQTNGNGGDNTGYEQYEQASQADD